MQNYFSAENVRILHKNGRPLMFVKIKMDWGVVQVCKCVRCKGLTLGNIFNLLDFLCGLSKFFFQALEVRESQRKIAVFA